MLLYEMDNWIDLKILRKFNYGDLKYFLFICYFDDQKVY